MKKIKMFLFVAVVCAFVTACAMCVQALSVPVFAITRPLCVVLDAGHGGIDGGVVSVDGVKESTLNLAYARELGKTFEQRGFNVVQTRRTEDGLYGLPTKGFKSRDMKARKEIIDNARPNLVISVHMNKFSQSSRVGPQVFYQQGKTDGQQLAASLQKVFNDYTGNSHQAIGGDYYVCREVDCPAVIVECGFLSNAAESELLQTDAYREQICEYIFRGVMLYLYEQ